MESRQGDHLATGRVLLVVGVLVLVALITFVIVWLVRPDSTVGGPDPRAALAQVHGLGVNPADGSLVVATRGGSFRLSDAGLERLGNS